MVSRRARKGNSTSSAELSSVKLLRAKLEDMRKQLRELTGRLQTTETIKETTPITQLDEGARTLSVAACVAGRVCAPGETCALCRLEGQTIGSRSFDVTESTESGSISGTRGGQQFSSSGVPSVSHSGSPPSGGVLTS
jgi:hypothetical protein